jgi:hypothetical protein
VSEVSRDKSTFRKSGVQHLIFFGGEVHIRLTRKTSNAGPFIAFVICQLFAVAKQERNFLFLAV